MLIGIGHVAGLGGMPGDPGYGFADGGLCGRHRAAGGDMRMAARRKVRRPAERHRRQIVG